MTSFPQSLASGPSSGRLSGTSLRHRSCPLAGCRSQRKLQARRSTVDMHAGLTSRSSGPGRSPFPRTPVRASTEMLGCSRTLRACCGRACRPPPDTHRSVDQCGDTRRTASDQIAFVRCIARHVRQLARRRDRAGLSLQRHKMPSVRSCSADLLARARGGEREEGRGLWLCRDRRACI